MTKLKRNFARPTAGLAAAVIALGGAGWGAPGGSAPQAPTGESSPPQIGEFKIRGKATYYARLNGGAITARLRGPQLSLTSARYDLAAPSIDVQVRGGRVSRADAMGGVRVEVRNPEAKQTTQLRCDSAVYTAYPAGSGKIGRIDLRGNVRSTLYDPVNLSQPLITTGESGYVELIDRATYDVQLNQGSVTGTPREPAPRPKKPGP